mmetsp:Transcript_2130/g.6379  ORF Transcript_2130/g.6379 Transcript_2130/m.6379 type:complete len:221 (-) Transcript_2130:166-828(-)
MAGVAVEYHARAHLVGVERRGALAIIGRGTLKVMATFLSRSDGRWHLVPQPHDRLPQPRVWQPALGLPSGVETTPPTNTQLPAVLVLTEAQIELGQAHFTQVVLEQRHIPLAKNFLLPHCRVTFHALHGLGVAPLPWELAVCRDIIGFVTASLQPNQLVLLCRDRAPARVVARRALVYRAHVICPKRPVPLLAVAVATSLFGPDALLPCLLQLGRVACPS